MDREHETAAVAELLDAAARGEGRMLTAYGGAGSGKSALLDAAVSNARREGFTVLLARGSHAERELPFGLVGRLFEPVLPQLSPAPVLVGHRPHVADAALADLHELNKALAELTTTGPVLIAVDDVPQADCPSLRWLASVPQRIERMPVALLATASGEPCSDPALVDEVLAGSSRELRPAAIGPAGAATVLERVLGATPAPSFVTACLLATSGNPLLLTALAEALAERSVVPADAAVADIAVPGLEPALRARLRRVSPHALAIARALAALDGKADLLRIADVTGIDPPTVAEVAETLSRLGLIRLAGQQLDFTCSLLRNTITGELPFTALQAVNSQAAALLWESGAPATSVAERLLATRPLAQPWVSGALRDAAGEALGSGHPDIAIAYLRRALDEPLPPDERAAVITDLGEAEAHLDLPAAVRHLGESAERVLLADLLVLTGRYPEGVELAGDTDDARSVALRLHLEPAAGSALERLDELRADAPGDPRSLSLLALRELWLGRSRTAAVAFAEQALADVPFDAEAATSAVRAVLVLAAADRLEDALAHCDSLVNGARRWGHRPALAAARSARSVVIRRLGRPAAALEDAHAGVDLLVDCGADRRRGVAVEYLARLVHILVDMGRYDEATGLLERADLMGEIRRSWAGVELLFARGRLRVASGHPAAGVRDLLAAGARLASWEVANPAVVPWRSEAATALLELGEAQEAREHAAEEVELARRWGAAEPLGLALRAHGVVVGGPRGLALLEEAVSLADAPMALARCLTDYGAAMRRSGRPVPARRVLHTALDLAQKCQSATLARRASTELATAGGRRLKSRQSDVDGLTASERRAATLAAEGRTNREIAEVLFVQRRTVEIHLTNAYRKLGIAGRDGLVSALRRSTRPERATG
ncbi:AAA family ATPase [Lentzea tibetensis]|uniref:AAA family ATPase n=1 Tax=Lentzea tibetensis TaxID=2591470 RepID=UPI0038B242D4